MTNYLDRNPVRYARDSLLIHPYCH